MAVRYNIEHMFSYIKGAATAMEWQDTLAALYFARKCHKDQQRKNGEPYIVHPLTMACHAITLGLRNDAIIAVCLLHDVVEDCGVDCNDIPCSDKVRNAVRLLSKKGGGMDGLSTEEYYQQISTSFTASMVKLIDRCNNVSTMAEVFTPAKLEEYIAETRTFVLPLIRTIKESYPEYSNQLFLLKYQIVSVVDAIEASMQAFH